MNDDGGVTLYNLPMDMPLEVRGWQAGDRFQPPWRASPSALVAFLRGQRVPLEERRAAPVLCRAGTHEVLAVLHPRHVASGFDAPTSSLSADNTDEEAIQQQQRRALWVKLEGVGRGAS